MTRKDLLKKMKKLDFRLNDDHAKKIVNNYVKGTLKSVRNIYFEPVLVRGFSSPRIIVSIIYNSGVKSEHRYLNDYAYFL